MTDLSEPLVVELTVAAPVERAFATWVDLPGRWWPKGHTVSGDPAAIVVEATPGGRIFERGPDGAEHEWGRVLACERPHRIAYRWHLFFSPDEATDVVVAFEPDGDGTRVRIEQTGWERLGEAGAVRRERTTAGWAAVTRPYADLLAAGDPPAEPVPGDGDPNAETTATTAMTDPEEGTP